MPIAIQMKRYGKPEVMKPTKIKLSTLKNNEIRIRSIASAVNRADIEIRSGNWPIRKKEPFPYTPGLEVVGDVIEVGTKVKKIKTGDRVITMMQKLGGIHGVCPGGYQEVVTVQANKVATLPKDLNPFAIASLGLAAVTAINGIERLNIEEGHKVVVLGASGGVGSCATIIAKALGAEVIAVTSNKAKQEYLKSIGADQVISLKGTSLVKALGKQSVNGVFETIGEKTFADSTAILKTGGSLCLVGALTGENLNLCAWDLIRDLKISGYSSENLTASVLQRNMEQICSWLGSNAIQSIPYKKFALNEVIEVHKLMESDQLTGRALLV